MAEAKKASLTVLGGSLAGASAELPDDGVVILGSAPDCTFRLDAPSVSPQHARIVIEGGKATVHSTGTRRAIHVNDNPLGESATLRNGDILWLGVPGEEDVVMLQCILHETPAPPPAPSPAVPTPEIETTALWTTPPSPEGALAPPAESPGARRTGAEPTIALTPEQIQGAQFEMAQAPPTPPPPPAPTNPAEEEPLLIALDPPPEEEAVVVGESDLVSADDIAPASFDASDEAVVVDEDELFAEAAPTFVGVPEDSGLERPPAEPAPPPSPPAPPAPPQPEADLPVGAIVEDAVPVVDPLPSPIVPDIPPSPDAASTGAPPPPPETHLPDEPSPTVVIPEPPPPETSSPPAPNPDVSAPAAPRPDRARPAPRAVPQRRRMVGRPTPRPEVEPEDEYEDHGDEEQPDRSPVLLALAGFVGVLLVAGLGWAVWRFVVASPAPAPTPVPVAAATTAPPPSTPPAAPVAADPTPPQPATAAAPPTTTPRPLPTATPPPPTAAVAPPTPTPPPTAAPTPTPTPTPPPVTQPAVPAGPSPEELQAQQTAQRIEALLGQADAALNAGQHEDAIARYTEALDLDPQSSRATAGRARAMALRDQARRRFVPTRTRVQTEKEQEGGIAGFDMGDADLRKTPDFQGRIEFEMNPATGLTAGAAWTLRIFVVNEGEKPIQIQGLQAVTQVNGSGASSAVPPRARQVPTQQRLLVGELSGTWQQGTSAWSTAVTVTANKGDSLRASLTWR